MFSVDALNRTRECGSAEEETAREAARLVSCELSRGFQRCETTGRVADGSHGFQVTTVGRTGILMLSDVLDKDFGQAATGSTWFAERFGSSEIQEFTMTRSDAIRRGRTIIIAWAAGAIVFGLGSGVYPWL